MFFIDSSVTSEQRDAILRQDKSELKRLEGEARQNAEDRLKAVDVRLAVALDAATGKELWSKPVDVTDCSEIGIGGGKLTMMYHDGVLILCGANANGHYWKQFVAGEFSRRRLVALSAQDGYKLWAKDANYRHRPIIVGDRVIAEPWAFDLKSGEQKTREHPLTGEAVPWTFMRPGHHCGALSACDNMLLFRSGYTGFLRFVGRCRHEALRRTSARLLDQRHSGQRPGRHSGSQRRMRLHVLDRLDHRHGTPRAPPSVEPVQRRRADDACQADVAELRRPRGPPRQQWQAVARVSTSHAQPQAGNEPRSEVELRDGVPARTGASSPTTVTHPSTARRSWPGSCLPGRGDSNASRFRCWARTTVRALTPCGSSSPVRQGDKQGQRVFDVRVQGELSCQGVDVAAESGSDAGFVVREVKNIPVSDNLVIELDSRHDQPTPLQMPILCGLEVERSDP